MAVLTAFSGLNGKLPAAFLLETQGRRILLDLGEGPEPGIRPDLCGIGRVDAIFLSHGHIDHVGAIDLWADLGGPPVHATAATFAALPLLGRTLPEAARRLLPLQGAARIRDLPVVLGRSGHAIGGVWLCVPGDGGVLYMGDFSRESALLPFDPPPRAGLVITDISYGDRDQSLGEQLATLVRDATPGSVLPVPVMGRGSEITLRLAEAGCPVVTCPLVRAEMQALCGDRSGQLAPGMADRLARALARLRAVSQPGDCTRSEVVVLADTELPGDLMSQFIDDPCGWRFLPTGHVAPRSRAARLIAAGRGKPLAWNVHPRRSDHLWLAAHCGARLMLPAFGRLAEAPELDAALAGLWRLDPIITTAMEAA